MTIPSRCGTSPSACRSRRRRLSHLVQDVIDLSRLQGDDPLTHAEVVDVDDLDPAGRGRGPDGWPLKEAIELIVGEPSGAMVYGDHGQLLTAVRNLLANAISYSPSHTRVAVSVRASESIVEISVKDQGIGIPVNDLDRIFERFYRVDQARSRVTGGTGLGLAIVKHVCQNHGGECTVWSEPGSRLDVHPAAAGLPGLDAVRPRGSGARGRHADDPRRRGAPMTRVLVVEDEESFSEALAFMLRREGYEVEVAADGLCRRRRLRAARCRSDPSRPHAARPVRHRGLPPCPRRRRRYRSSC